MEYSRYIPVIYIETYTWYIPEIFQNDSERISQTYTRYITGIEKELSYSRDIPVYLGNMYQLVIYMEYSMNISIMQIPDVRVR